MKNILKKTLPLVLFFILIPLFAREVEITVEDTDLGLPLEGAVIRSWDGSQYVCNREGKAFITVPDERQVLVYAAYPGYENSRLVVTAGVDKYTIGLRLAGIIENKELVIEASRPGSSETKTGRSVALTERDIAQTGEIGIIEDVMNSIKLLPGVGYAGFFNALPSIRGGDPGDLTASLDGYYIFNPYHWGGGYSIFDPRMVQSAQLSHGVFSSRYGHTISGLLEITSKNPSPLNTEFELGVNTSAANFNLSLPLNGKGGLLFMGRVTYYDPVIWLFKQLSRSIETLEPVNAIRRAPYIRSTAITGNYRFSDTLELHGTGFWGMDGIGVSFDNGPTTEDGITSSTMINFDWANYQGFFTAGLLWNPRSDMLVKFSAGIGYEDAVIDGDIEIDIFNKSFSDEFKNNPFYSDLSSPLLTNNFDDYSFGTNIRIKESDFLFNMQGRIDYDWELGKGFLFAAGVQEMFSRFVSSGDQMIIADVQFNNLSPFDQSLLKAYLSPYLSPSSDVYDYLYIGAPLQFSPDTRNKLFTTSGYGLVEYTTPNKRFSAELGLRVDHFYLSGKDFSLQSKPALNPRLNLDFTVLEDKGFLQSLDLNAGTGLFSSMNNAIVLMEEKYKINEIKPNRSWTSIAGAKLEFSGGLSFNIEFYYKYVFDRMYIPFNPSLDGFDILPKSNGEGRIWGIDLILQKMHSRYWDGWLSYSFNWAKYRDPEGGNFEMGLSGGTRGDQWYFPSYHRFHNLNLVLNFRPAPRINIYTRFGIASGIPLLRRIGDKPESYPLALPDPSKPSGYQFIERYYWPSVYDENNRTTPSFPMDIKFSIFGKNEKGKAHFELYVAVENVLALLYTARGNTTFNQYTGKVDKGSSNAFYDVPVPIPSFGFKVSY